MSDQPPKTTRSVSLGYGFENIHPLQQNFSTSLSIQDMINSTKKCCTQWGIEGYTINSNGGPLTTNPKYAFSKQQKQFQTIGQKQLASFPASPDHHKELSWNKAQGKFHPGNRKSVIDEQAIKRQSFPSPVSYKTEVKEKAKFIPFNKGEKTDFLCDSEFLGKFNPGAGKYDPSLKLVKEKSVEFKYHTDIKEKKGWKPEKTTLPDCALYKVDKADKFVYKTSPRFASMKVEL